MKKPTKEEVIQRARELAGQIEAAIVALETETDAIQMLDHVGLVCDGGRINALRKVLRDRALELFDKAKMK